MPFARSSLVGTPLSRLGSVEKDVSGEHGRDAGDLLLVVHDEVAGNIGMEIKRHRTTHSKCTDGEGQRSF